MGRFYPPIISFYHRYNKLSGKRITSIDTFRGITILVMVLWTNGQEYGKYRHGWNICLQKQIPWVLWIVFPAFLFIAGMSIPFALNKRVTNNYSGGKLQKHILRCVPDCSASVFMVNGESAGPHAMPLYACPEFLLCCHLLCVISAFLLGDRNKRA